MREVGSGRGGPSARDLGLSLDTTRPVPDAAATPQPVEIPVLYEDDILLVVNKPAGLATMPRGRYVARSVVAQMRWVRGDARIVAAHRLDRLTSGVLVLVKDPAWRGRVQTLFERRAPGLRKRYVARTAAEPTPALCTDAANLVTVSVLAGEGRAAGEAAASAMETSGLRPAVGLTAVSLPQDLTQPFEVSLPLLKEPGRWQCRVDGAGRVCRTRVLGREPAGEVMAWALEPLTGYTHQLRVTLAALGYPILGDPLYPEISPAYTTDAGDAVRMDLHAASLTLPAPDGGPSWPSFTAPVPWLG